jgi:hypothetical protein
MVTGTLADTIARHRSRVPLVILTLALAIYLDLALPQLHSPGLHHDEAQEAGLQAMQLLTGQPVTLFRGVGVAGRFPLMVQDYIGAFHVYWAVPFLAIGGVTVEGLRASFVALGLLTLIALYITAREVWNAWVGAAAALVLAAMPAFVFWTRQGVLIASITLPVSLMALWAAVRWRRALSPAAGEGRRARTWPYAALAMFLLGFGLYAKLLTLWFALAAVLMAILVMLPDAVRWLRERRMPFGWPDAVAALAGGLAGLAPLIAYNILSGGTLLSVTQNLGVSYYGVNNANFGANLITRLRQVRDVLDGPVFPDTVGGLFSNRLMTPALVLAAVLIVLALFRRRSPGSMWLLGAAVLMVVQSSFTVSALWHTHFGLHLPWLALVIVVGFGDALPALLNRQGSAPAAVADVPPARQSFTIPQIVFTLAVIALAASNAATTLRYHAELGTTGGQPAASPAIYSLADALGDLEPLPPVVAMDWGIAPSVSFLTAGRVNPQEVFGYTWEPDAGFAPRVEGFLAAGDAAFVFHAPDRTVFPRRDVFTALLDAHPELSAEMIPVLDPALYPHFEIVRVTRR